MGFLQKIKDVRSPEAEANKRDAVSVIKNSEGDLLSLPARIAVYDSLNSLPRIVEFSAASSSEFIDLLSSRVYRLSQEKGGKIPFIVINEVVENLVHARFKEVVVTILGNGNTIRISDQGPGIRDKEKAFEPGFSTATAEMKKVIKGVGSGLPIAKETISLSGGEISIEDNLEEGTVITLKSVPSELEKKDKIEAETSKEAPVLSINLNDRQKMVLSLVMELGSAGPSRVARELNISLSSAYRDLLFLTKEELISSDNQGKRSLTTEGTDYLGKIFSTST